jgi:5-methylcytosine-specific restriction protein A
MELEVGDLYHREDDLASKGGIWQSGIITSKESSYVFLITGERGEDFGYDDEFLPSGHLVYTAQGGEGNMDWRYVNRAIRDHKELGKEIHVFETTDENYFVEYMGKYVYRSHYWTELPDKNEDMREAIRFRLEGRGELGR